MAVKDNASTASVADHTPACSQPPCLPPKLARTRAARHPRPLQAPPQMANIWTKHEQTLKVQADCLIAVA
uniref:Uncharacterized protein n=1 Tax=Mycena chlorophos TaxID=658473 RepID=A0ABQ0L7H7_MYCCL|nr:predicted protein [Mycena chlorophos]